MKRTGPIRVMLHRRDPAEHQLSSIRMSMLAHGFKETDAAGHHEFVPDESGPLSYSVVGLRRGWSVGLVVAVISITLVIVLVLLFA